MDLDVEGFVRDGYVAVRGAFGAAAAACREMIWGALGERGVGEDDPATWPSLVHIDNLADGPFAAVGRSPALAAAYDVLIGPGRWAPYDTYAAPGHQLCCAHALRELQAVADAAPHGQWCWATQAAEALAAMQDLVREAAVQGRDAVDPDALAAQVRLFRSAVLVGASQTAARSGPLMKKHHALARRLRDRQDDYLRFTSDFRAPPDNNGAERDTGWPSGSRKYPAACAP